MNRTFVFRLFIIHLAVGICGARAIAATASSPVSRNDPQANAQAARVQKAADDAITAAYATADKGDFDKACAQADDALGQLVASGAKADDAFRQIALARRLLGQLKKVDPSVRTDLYQYLRKNDPLAKAMAFGLADGKDGKDAYLLLDRLRKKFPNVAQLPNLAAAISLTHDKPIQTHLNENIVKSADPLELYAYFTANEKRMSFGLRNVPVELLVYVVDTTASIAELNWALEHYAGRQNIGDLFAMVRYDESAFSRGTQKAVSANGYNLPNVLRYGGVCVDQAYFAEQVGKAIGVPTATDKGRSSEVSHAWVGFLQFNGKQGLWNFDSGRYASYKHVRGDVRDPQTRESIPDSFVAILGESIGSDPKDRELAAAYVDAAQMIIESGQVPRAAAAAGSPGKQPTSQGSPSVAALDLIESGLRHNQWYLPGWTAVGDLAQKSQMTLDQKRRWSALVQQLCGQKYPDFALSILIPMVKTVDDLDAQARLWEAAFNTFQSRPDLAADLRMSEAKMFEDKGDFAKAGECYTDVIRRFVNVTPVAMDAVDGAETMLNRMNQGGKVLELYKWAASLAIRPSQPMATQFERQSNWYRINEAYKRRLAEGSQRSH